MEDLTTDSVLSNIRFDAETRRGSVLDVIQFITGCGKNNVSRTLARIVETHPIIQNELADFTFQGAFQRPTPVATIPTLVKIAMLCPGKTSQKWRLNAAEVLCRAFGGDETLCREIEYQNAIGEANPGSKIPLFRECPDPNGWTPLQKLNFEPCEDEEDPSGLVYLAGSPDVGFVKIGSWSGDEESLLSRYKMYYGPRTWVKTWHFEDRLICERQALESMSHRSVGGELIYADSFREAIEAIDSIKKFAEV